MDKQNNRPLPHPGQFIRDTILKPKGLTVSAAAALVGVGRQAFSTFINGRAAATPDMATRLEVAFEVPAAKILEIQAAFDAQGKSLQAAGEVRRHVIPLFTPTANDIVAWVEHNIGARSRFAVFVRTLVNSTTTLQAVYFPGNDDAERPGWDGWTECQVGNPWVPAGKCGWELGTNTNPKTKADGDYEKSVEAHSAATRAEMAFIFVTPRSWPGKAAWVKSKLAQKQWREVRAYDSSDLEQWLEQSVAAQAWFAAETNMPTAGIKSLDKCWDDWVGVAPDRLPPQLFDSAIAAAKRSLTSWAERSPDKPLIVAADSVEEALAFLSRAFAEEVSPELAKLRDKCIVFTAPGSLAKVAGGVKDFIAIAANSEVERELAPFATQLKAIAIPPRNAVAGLPEIVLQPLTGDAFSKALEAGSGLRQEAINRIARESGRSLTVLRRRLSTVPAIQTPSWAGNPQTALSLLPFLLSGAWCATNSTDQATICRLAGVDSYDVIEERVQALVAMPDSPLWSVGEFRGVVSKIDLLFSLKHVLTSPMLTRFFAVAKDVLGEDDPKLDLPEDERWAAALHKKTRAYSHSIREGVAETVVLLAVHGDDLVGERTGFRCEEAAALLVRDLLSPLTTRRLEASQNDLPAYAEAAPDEFLRLIEEDLNTASPQTFGILRNVDSFFGGCPRTGLLWALENLAWNPGTLRRVALILARLSQIELTDNWSNKPIASLQWILSSWMPQTAADHATRVKTVQLVVDKFPAVGWRLCLALIDGNGQIGHYAHKPKWRNDGHGHGEPFGSWDPIFKFRFEVAAILLAWKHPLDSGMLCDVVEALYSLKPEHQDQVWGMVGAWAGTATDDEKARVREKVRITILSKRAAKRAKRSDFADLSAKGKAAFQALEPTDPVALHQWLFKDTWVPDSADELVGGDDNFEKRDERIRQQQIAALKQVWGKESAAGVRRLAAGGNAASIIGALLAGNVVDRATLVDFLTSTTDTEPAFSLAGGALASMDAPERVSVLNALRNVVSGEMYLTLLLSAPFDSTTWKLIDALPAERQAMYWRKTRPWRVDETDMVEAVERLVSADRPRAAFAVSKYRSKGLPVELLYRVLSEIARGSGEEAGTYQLEQHWIQKSFEVLASSSALTLEQKAGLEFAYIDALAAMYGRERGHLHSLERYVERHPDFFVQALRWAYKRRHGGQDPVDPQVPPDRLPSMADRAYKVLEGLNRLPGYGDGDEVKYENLLQWVQKVRAGAAEADRAAVGDIAIGRLLSVCRDGADGIWPSEPVRQVMEEIQSRDIARGASVGRFNSRGVVTGGRGGADEWALAKQYRDAAKAIEFSYPFVATQLLEDMAAQYERLAKREDLDDRVTERLR